MVTTSPLFNLWLAPIWPFSHSLNCANRADGWQIYVNGDLMLDYELRETSSDADVTVFA